MITTHTNKMKLGQSTNDITDYLLSYKAKLSDASLVTGF
jgi:hypothetical protein